MSRALQVARRELTFNFRRPLFWIFIFLLGFFEQQMATGNVTIMMSGDSSVGGTQQWLNSEFAVAQVFTALINIMYLMFWSIAAGMSQARADIALPSAATRIRGRESFMVFSSGQLNVENVLKDKTTGRNGIGLRGHSARISAHSSVVAEP